MKLCNICKTSKTFTEIKNRSPNYYKVKTM